MLKFALGTGLRKLTIIAPTLIAFALTLASLAYLAFALLRVIAFGKQRAGPSAYQPPISLLKPVCGLEPELYQNLRTFCDQDYPDYQIIFGVRDPNDPAIAVIKRLIREFPQRHAALIVDETVTGTNFKVSNLANMYRAVEHDLLVIADSDMRVGRDYLGAVAAPFADLQVGAATCLYMGVPVDGFASRLGAMFINDCFAPSVLVALSFQELRYCFGATMAVRRPALEKMGGFAVLTDQLADDHMLGKRIAEQGLKVALPAYVVENHVWESGFKALFLHELRWARTIRAMQPVGYAFSFITYPVAVSALLVLIFPMKAAGLTLLAVSVIMRALLHWSVHAGFRIPGPTQAWLAPFRDLLSFVVWVVSFFGRSVQWREQNFSVRRDGQLTK
ncbi:MAG TPA: bacteriohopanetetrol glucosamine biosynthesis glycosyltransferase HpnI [Burkholderiales bacterium]|nr:bacteriohopanetetrol glucosamine biosynthesis glycosyltransferase HpnI [Burkholderiales bacterium]